MAADRHHVFVCHASADRAIARSVRDAMGAAGAHAWVDEHDIPAGAVWAEAIVDAIQASDLVLVLLSAASIRSEHVLREVELAADLQRPILGVRLDDAPLSSAMRYFFGVRQLMTPVSIEAIADAVAARLSDTSTPPPTSDDPDDRRATPRHRNDVATATTKAPRRRRAPLIAGGAFVVIALAVGGIVAWTTMNGDDPPERTIDFVRVTPGPVWVAANDRVWVTSAPPEGGVVTAVDTRPLTVGKVTAVGAAPYGVAATDDAVWVANGASSTVTRVASDGSTVDLPTGPLPYGVATHDDLVWVTSSGDGTVAEFDSSGALRRTITVGGAPQGIASDGSSLWIAHGGPSPGCAKVDLASGKVVAEVSMPDGADAVAIGSGSVWVTNVKTGDVSRIDTTRTSTTANIHVGSGPQAVVVTPEGVWVSVAGIDQVVRIDPASNRVVERITTRAEPLGMAWHDGELIVANHGAGTIQVIR